MTDFIYGYSAAASYLGCSPQRLYNLVSSGRISVFDVSSSRLRIRGQLVKYGFRRSDLDSYRSSVRRYYESRLAKFA